MYTLCTYIILYEEHKGTWWCLLKYACIINIIYLISNIYYLHIHLSSGYWTCQTKLSVPVENKKLTPTPTTAEDRDT